MLSEIEGSVRFSQGEKAAELTLRQAQDDGKFD
jgi:hypothetical protein